MLSFHNRLCLLVNIKGEMTRNVNTFIGWNLCINWCKDFIYFKSLNVDSSLIFHPLRLFLKTHWQLSLEQCNCFVNHAVFKKIIDSLYISEGLQQVFIRQILQKHAIMWLRIVKQTWLLLKMTSSCKKYSKLGISCHTWRQLYNTTENSKRNMTKFLRLVQIFSVSVGIIGDQKDIRN